MYSIKSILSKPVQYMKGDRVYFRHGGQAGGAETPAELCARNYYELNQLHDICNKLSIYGHKAVELGCGYGRLTPWLGTITDAYEVIGIDHNDDSIDLARQQYPQDKYTWYTGGVEKSSNWVKEQTADVVLSWTVFQHLSPKLMEQAANEVQISLAEEGHLIMAEETSTDDADHVWGRSLTQYDDIFDGLDRIHHEQRQLEPTYEKYSSGGQIAIYKKSE